MTGVRARKSRRNKRANTTRPAQKKKKIKKKIKIQNKTIQKHWDHSKTMKQNFKDLGLSCDVNMSMPVIKKKKTEGEETMEVDSTTSVVQEFEQLAQTEEKKERHISPGEAQFVWNLIQKHGNDYKAMARDKMNIYQHTTNQIKRKCEAFLRSSQDFSQHLQNKG
ncbi:nucleolar protein 16 isoform X2 [Exaiptasia diaphana]|uniref:Nucleolar protein 16 n=1 Tax=Exaiptasia diaphana TaxID=2652724 RepID=A0A913YTL6_EXADI|nr:nucleolar protein 16 isoform X2 [Exaiptasia diaphana]